MKTILATALLLGVSCISANAQSFSFQSTSHTVNSLTAQVSMGKPVLAAFSSGSSTNTDSTGKKSTTTSNCAFWSAEPGSQFTFVGACNVKESNGDESSVVASCVATNAAQTEGDCWGGMTGTAGLHKGKTGTISWHQKPSADNKTGMAWGVGQWND